jgi:ABC-type lipoprotein release transport system permease subunit
MLLTGSGVVLGLIAAAEATRLMTSLLFGEQARDPMVFAVAPAVLLAVAGVASYIPARRASRVDPLVALRFSIRTNRRGPRGSVWIRWTARSW